MTHRFNAKRLFRRKAMKNLTLVEMLVVIAIVCVLGSLLLGGLARSMESARLAICAQQLKQLGGLTHVYATDHDGELPDFYYTKNAHQFKGGFVLLIEPEMAAMPGWAKYDPANLTCPSDVNPKLHHVRMDDDSVKDIPVSYGVNIGVDLNDISWRQIPAPSSCPFFYDGVMNNKGDGKFQGRFWTTETFTGDTMRWRHQVSDGYSNLLFADWHVEGYDRLDTLPDFDLGLAVVEEK